MKKFRLSFIIILISLYSSNAQVDWPFEDEDTQATIVGSIGEPRATGGVLARFHKGVDITNGTDYNIYAINAGTVTFFNSGGNWSQGSSYIRIGDVYYYHCRPSASIIQDGSGNSTVEAGDFIGTMITSGSIHVHLQENNTNYLNSNLDPFVDNHAPILNLTRFNNGYRIYRNGLTYNSTQTEQNNLELTQTVDIEGESFRTLFSKIDISADVEDRRTTPTGGDGGGSTAPFGYEIELRTFENPDTNNALHNFSMEFDEVPDNAASDFVFHPQSDPPPQAYVCTHIITSNPRDTPYDRYFNTAIRENLTEDWANNNLLNARYNGEAEFPDNKYRLYIDAYDVDFDDNPNNRLANRLNIPVIIDNFLPYITQVKVSSGNVSNTLFYQGRWAYTNNALNFIVDVNNTSIPANQPLRIEVETSEPMEDILLVLAGNLYFLNEQNDDTHFMIDIVSPSLNLGLNTLNFSGNDLANNQLLSNPNVLPVKQANGNWPAGVITGNDTYHQINAVNGNGIYFGADFVTGFCSGQGRNGTTNCLEICFQDSSSPSSDITNWLWEFGDFNNSTSTDQNPTFIYDSPGTYEVTLTVTNTNNETSTTTKTITVDDCTVNIEPLIISDVTSGVGPLTVNFDDLSTGDIYSREWNITPSTGWQFVSGGQNSTDIELLFYTSTTYQVNLTLEDEFGDTITSNTITIDVSVNSGTDLYVDFHTEGLVYTGSIIQFESDISQGCNEFDYQWTFHDYNGPHYSTLPNTSYVFPVPGNYVVELCVTDNCGNHECVSKNIHIANYTSNVFANFLTSIDHQNWIVEKGQPIEFWDTSQPVGDILYGSWFFDYNEGASGPDYFYYYPRSGNPITHTYNEVGTYRVRLYVGENPAYFGSFKEQIITVVDEYDYLEIPTLHESHSQVFQNKTFDRFKIKEFDNHMLTFTNKYSSSGNYEFQHSALEVYKKSANGDYDLVATLLDNITSSSASSCDILYSGDQDKVAILTRDIEGLITNYTLTIYRRLGNDWSNYEVMQTLNHTTDRSLDDYFYWPNYSYYNDMIIKDDVLLIHERRSTEIEYECDPPSPNCTYSRGSSTIVLYEMNDETGLFERKANLIAGSPLWDGAVSQTQVGFGRDIAMSNNNIIIGNDYSTIASGGINVYSESDIGWVNSTERATLKPQPHNYNNNYYGSPLKINNDLILSVGGRDSGITLYKAPSNGWSGNLLPNATYKKYTQNVEDYNPYSFVSSDLNISDNRNYLIVGGSAVRDFNNPEHINWWQVSTVFYKDGNSWQSKNKEDLRLYPLTGLTNDMFGGNKTDEHSGYIIQPFSIHSTLSIPKKTILYTYDLNGNGNGQSGGGICFQDVSLNNEIYNSNQPGAEGQNITITNSTYNNGSGVVYQATNSIKILPNTEIKPGAYFSAKIVECNLIDQ